MSVYYYKAFGSGASRKIWIIWVVKHFRILKLPRGFLMHIEKTFLTKGKLAQRDENCFHVFNIFKRKL